MKNIKYAIAAIALGSLSFGSFAADQVNSVPARQQSMGVINVNGYDATSVQSDLAEKAAQAGAKSFRIISVTGYNEIHGKAELYQ
ncbi:DUF1471 domain-containing protein [Sodalis ligni]|uniref:multiple stress resistance protein BhsA n=1 Tax=Sodalis ligni TaxID=2697027 RepID=UPI00193F2867|nr:YdgH/BhsA/McbA-like domain containing protein [Sodalis ligni]QWA10665.1 DUF1471 domain-containing protein [Sodalis ligni]